MSSSVRDDLIESRETDLCFSGVIGRVSCFEDDIVSLQ